MSGWISLDRAITKHWLWQNEKFTKGQAWIDLLLWAAHTPHKVLLKGTLITVERGEQIRSQVTLSKAWNWDRKTVSRFLKLLEKDGMIASRVDHLTSYISICNYDSFQDNTKGDTQLKGQLKGQQAPSREDTNNKGNKENNDNIDDIEPKKVVTIDYSAVKDIFNKYFVAGVDPITQEKLYPSLVKQLTPKRKKAIDVFFKQTKLDLDKFEGYIEHVATEQAWLYLRKQNGKYKQRPFEFYMKLDTFVKAVEEKENNE